MTTRRIVDGVASPGARAAKGWLAAAVVLASLPFALARAGTVTVVSGDTLWGIARKHGTDVATLRRIDPGLGADLRPGQVVELPAEARHVLAPGESLATVAERHGTDVPSLIDLNDLQGPTVNPGAALALPDSGRDAEGTYEVRAGDTLYDIAARFGATVPDLIAANRLEGTVIRPGQRLVVTGIEVVPNDTPLPIVVEPGDTLSDIARAHGTTVARLQELNGLGDADRIRAGDTLTVPSGAAPGTHDVGASVVHERTVAPGDTLWEIARRHGASVAAVMALNDLSDSTIIVGRHLRLPGDLAAERATAGAGGRPELRLVRPLPGVVTSPFGYRDLRVNGSNFHSALDIDGVTGEPVRAAAPGEVTFSGWRGDYGNLVVVRDGDVEYRYAHNSELRVAAGQRVEAGDTLALVGDTGLSFGDHLHFEVRVGGRAIDPLPLLGAR